MADVNKEVNVSEHFKSLDPAARKRYMQKISCLGGIDPYTIECKELSDSPYLLPSVSYPDIVNYLVFSPSPYTLDDLRCYKGLDAYNQFVSGWVRDVAAIEINNKIVVRGRVMHSQRPRETPLKPWVIAEKDGKIVGGHCDCMAGLGETCTHVSAMLFFIETKVRIRDSRTVTQEAAYWKLPTAMKNIQYLPVSEIDFTSAKTKKKQIDDLVDSNDVHTPGKRQSKQVPEPTSDEIAMLFDKLSMNNSNAAILSIVPGHCHAFKPTLLSGNYATILTDLYNPECINLPFNELLDKCEEIKLHISEDQAVAVEQATRAQADNKMWFRFRAGRVTASKMKMVCHSNPDQPSQSLVKAICYPTSKLNAFSNSAMKWGCKHEATARQAYVEQMSSRHDNFVLCSSGLVINKEFPHIGASPDARITCDCCGTGVVEIKCPYCARNSSVEDYCSSNARACITNDGDHGVSLKADHAYMYQIQTQIHVTEVEFCDFVLWTEEELYVERILPSDTLWQDIVDKSNVFFRKAILPELVGKFYTRRTSSVLSPRQETQSPQTSTSEQTTSEGTSYCYCGGPEGVAAMIGCDDQNCEIGWFHLTCLKITKVPKGKWFCPECRKLQHNKKAKSRKTLNLD